MQGIGLCREKKEEGGGENRLSGLKTANSVGWLLSATCTDTDSFVPCFRGVFETTALGRPELIGGGTEGRAHRVQIGEGRGQADEG